MTGECKETERTGDDRGSTGTESRSSIRRGACKPVRNKRERKADHVEAESPINHEPIQTLARPTKADYTSVGSATSRSACNIQTIA